MGDLGEDGHQKLLGQVDLKDLAVRVGDEPRIGAPRGEIALDGTMQLAVEHDRVPGILQQLGVGAQTVGHVCVAEEVAVEPLREDPGVGAAGELEEPGEIDDLVIAPIADGRPRISGSGISQSIPSRLMR